MGSSSSSSTVLTDYRIRRHHLIILALCSVIFVLAVVIFQYRDNEGLLGFLTVTNTHFQLETAESPYHNLYSPIEAQSSEPTDDPYPVISTEHVYKAPVSSDRLWTNISSGTIARRVAHYDDRDGAYDGPIILVLLYWNIRTLPSKDIHYGKVVYANKTEVMLKPPTWKEGVRWPVKMKVLNFKLIYSLPSHEKPEVIFICVDESCSHHSAYITVRKAEKLPDIESQIDFAVCLHQPMFDFHDIETLVSWIEMNKILGASKILIYYQNINERVEDTIQKYVEEGLIETYDWFCNFTSKEEDSNNFGQTLMITDCFYRSMYRVKHLVLYDFDELIIPRSSNAITWHDMFRKIEEVQPLDKISNLQFCATSFHDNSTTIPFTSLGNKSNNSSAVPAAAGCSNFVDIPIMFKRTLSTDYSIDPLGKCTSMYHFKNIIYPERVKFPIIHDMQPLNGLRSFTVHPNIAMQHHYRISDSTKNEKKVEDLTMRKYFSKAIENISNRLCNDGNRNII